ncbi:hypothetical protein [Candidatus Halobonum tyrrellensis]|uniref:Uncharacterized protein n=1 Tax=Candidatus Halobonum tyrrellensis G22 TaxID=1324957 RepID=V4HI47_9EURY|nr:hypothetical protein [Candidatus Halobonum tyrrellensis]ESP87594.1 hypothetical protein K933_13152 [Candidatus Halobonum tyrrellensis G22]
MNARVLLAFGALALFLPVSGCAAGSLQLTAVNDTELAGHASHDPPTTRADPRDGRGETVKRAVENGSTTVTAPSPPLDSEGRTYAVDGAYYDLAVEPRGNHTEWSVTLLVDYNRSADDPTVEYADLSPVDRSVLRRATLQRPRRLYEGYDQGAVWRYTPAQLEASAFSEEYVAVRYGGDRVAVRIEREPVAVTEYRYTATQVAPSAGAYGASLRENYAFTLSPADLSSAERDLLARATNGTYYAGSSYDDVFRSVRNRLRAHDPVGSTDSGGSWVVRYDGTTYWAELEYEPLDFTG